MTDECVNWSLQQRQADRPQEHPWGFGRDPDTVTRFRRNWTPNPRKCRLCTKNGTFKTSRPDPSDTSALQERMAANPLGEAHIPTPPKQSRWLHSDLKFPKYLAWFTSGSPTWRADGAPWLLCCSPSAALPGTENGCDRSAGRPQASFGALGQSILRLVSLGMFLLALGLLPMPPCSVCHLENLKPADQRHPSRGPWAVEISPGWSTHARCP